MTSTLSVSETMKNFIEGIVKLIVDNPDKIFIEVTNTTKSILLQIKADKSDLGKIIGRKGRTINSLNILALVVKKSLIGETKDVFIEIVEDEKTPFFKKYNKVI